MEEDDDEEEDYLVKEAPEKFKCPITFKLMTDPVTAPDGRVSHYLSLFAAPADACT